MNEYKNAIVDDKYIIIDLDDPYLSITADHYSKNWLDVCIAIKP